MGGGNGGGRNLCDNFFFILQPCLSNFLDYLGVVVTYRLPSFMRYSRPYDANSSSPFLKCLLALMLTVLVRRLALNVTLGRLPSWFIILPMPLAQAASRYRLCDSLMAYGAVLSPYRWFSVVSSISSPPNGQTTSPFLMMISPNGLCLFKTKTPLPAPGSVDGNRRK